MVGSCSMLRGVEVSQFVLGLQGDIHFGSFRSFHLVATTKGCYRSIFPKMDDCRKSFFINLLNINKLADTILTGKNHHTSQS